ncbi:hypothetical protein E1N52_32470 [Paraburkholderia guartelaensis]|uniref:Integrase n=1 Tax=Paraburkholderia guartelaensis TaxID=2546446 RepID=A0A4R5L5F5_9BURK|nr:VPA1269 family protein [Paraburkholderia guartelaensis]TDG03937.1 hypothetical protein E1N52_32470 [Paraburkholderia guartelaensis]
MKYAFSEVGKFTEFKSEITGHILFVSHSDDKFQIPTHPDFERINAIGVAQQKHWESLTESREPKAELRESLCAFSNISTVSEYQAALDELLTVTMEVENLSKTRKRLKGAKTRTLDLLLALWSADQLAWPTKLPFDSKALYQYNEFTLAHHFAWFNEIKQASPSKSDTVKNRSATVILRSCTTTLGIKEIGDLTNDSLSMKRWEGTKKIFYGAVKCVLFIQKNQYGRASAFPSARWTRHLSGEVVDNKFLWAIEENSDMSPWASLLEKWIEKAKRNLIHRRTASTHFLRYLLEQSENIPSPAQFCRRDYSPCKSFKSWIDEKAEIGSDRYRANVVNHVADIFDWFILEKLTLEDDFGHPVVSPEHYNPIPRQASGGNPNQTHREAMPIRYINELVSILTEDDMAWPKRQLTDYFAFYNKAEKRWERVWSPVRAILLLVKLQLPLRTFQVRVLDSGECDTEIYRNGQWIGNDGPLAPDSSSVPIRRGFLRRFDDRKVLRTFTGFFINTNKTADQFREVQDRGYEIPWQNEQVIAWAQQIRDWQEKYNPIEAPINWEDVNEVEFQSRFTKEALAEHGEAAFLFRDPCAADPRYPIRSSRLSSLWNILMDELERRVAERGERLLNGEVIRFVKTRDVYGRAGSPIYDLHTLRVSLLTAYVTEGGVPIEILSKCIAGHASLVMTLYYIKTGPAYITEQLAMAQEKIAKKEKENFVRFLLDSKIEEVKEYAAFLDSSAVESLVATEPGAWVISDKGICPVGGNRCSIGGVKVTTVKGNVSDYAPVPGGAKNCVRCRFFITGPAFLGGLVAHFNAIGYRLMEASKKFREQSDAIKRIENQLLEAGRQADSPFDGTQLDLAYERCDQLMKQVDDIAASWHDTYKLIERCKSIMASTNASNGLNLVLAGSKADLDVAIELTSDFDLINSVCQVANVYPAEDSSMANLRRSKILDAMLSTNSCRPVFAELSDDESLRVGNEFVTFLQRRVGRPDAGALIEGRHMLEDSGLKKELTSYLEELSGKRVAFSDVLARDNRRNTRKILPGSQI